MKHFRLNKLVRDGILEYMLANQKPDYRILDRKEILLALKEKILEETNEFDPNDPKALKELADIMEVVESLADELGADFKKLRATQLKRRKEMGSFKKRAYIGALGVPGNNPWLEYYEKDPERFPEIK